MLDRIVRSPLFITAVVLVWCVVGFLILLLVAPPPPRSVFEPSAPLADSAASAASDLQVVSPAPTESARAPSAPGVPSATARPTTFRVANTGGDGVFLRRTPSLADRLVAWPDGTRLQSLDAPATGDGLDWQKVRDPRGNVGYIPSRYLARE